MKVTPLNTSYTQSFSNFIVDFSLATHYDMTILDPSGSETLFSDIVVIPGPISPTLVSNTDTTLIKNFCSQNPPPNICDEIYPLTATTLEKH